MVVVLRSLSAPFRVCFETTSAVASFDTLVCKSCNKLTTGETGFTCQINGNSEESHVGGLCE